MIIYLFFLLARVVKDVIYTCHFGNHCSIAQGITQSSQPWIQLFECKNS
jgi:hypothetical protein